jgi:hypothetical protein
MPRNVIEDILRSDVISALSQYNVSTGLFCHAHTSELNNKIKNKRYHTVSTDKRYHTVRTGSKFNRKNIATEEKSNSLMHIYIKMTAQFPGLVHAQVAGITYHVKLIFKPMLYISIIYKFCSFTGV